MDTNLYDSGDYLVTSFKLEKRWLPNIFKNYFVGGSIKIGNGFIKGGIESGIGYRMGKKIKTTMLFDVKSFLLSENIPKQYRNYLYGSVDPDFQQLVVNRTSRSSDLKVLNNTYHGSGMRGIDIDNPTLSTEDIFWRIKIDQSVPVLPGKLFLDIAGSPDLPETQYTAFGITLGPVIIPLFQSWEMDNYPKDITWITKRIRFMFVLADLTIGI